MNLPGLLLRNCFRSIRDVESTEGRGGVEVSGRKICRTGFGRKETLGVVCKRVQYDKVDPRDGRFKTGEGGVGSKGWGGSLDRRMIPYSLFLWEGRWTD